MLTPDNRFCECFESGGERVGLGVLECTPYEDLCFVIDNAKEGFLVRVEQHSITCSATSRAALELVYHL